MYNTLIAIKNFEYHLDWPENVEDSKGYPLLKERIDISWLWMETTPIDVIPTGITKFLAPLGTRVVADPSSVESFTRPNSEKVEVLPGNGEFNLLLLLPQDIQIRLTVDNLCNSPEYLEDITPILVDPEIKARV